MEVEWRAGVPSLSLSAEKFQGRTFGSKSFGTAYAFQGVNPLDFGEVYKYRFDVSEVKEPLTEIITGSGWSFVPVVSKGSSPANSVASSDGSARLRLVIRREEPHQSVGIEAAEDEELAGEAGDLLASQVDGADHESPRQLVLRVVRYLRARAQRAYDRAEIDRELPCRLPRLGEVLDL